MLNTIEKSQLMIGFIPLTDSAPLIIAQEEGFFADEGLEVTLSREVSWSNIRDKLMFGALDAAHMLAPMLLASSQGVGSVKKPLVTAYSFGLNGNAISVSNQIYAELEKLEPQLIMQPQATAVAMKKLVEQRKQQGDAPLRLAVVFPFSMHHYLLRFWLNSAGIDVDNDIQILVVPPPSVVQALEEDLIDGYCVGEPWNSHALEKGVGVPLISGYDIWNNAPEKVLGVRSQWAEANPQTHAALIRALYRASEWISQPQNRDEVIEYLTAPEYIGAPKNSIMNAFAGKLMSPDGTQVREVKRFTLPFRYQANFPWQSHAVWIVEQMQACGQLNEEMDAQAIAEQSYLTDFYRDTVQALGVKLPDSNYKVEGQHAEPWSMDGIDLAEDMFYCGASDS
ncbi:MULTISPECIES: CmpA/NrtA family ABC transporter substrate-binding protein [Thiomicrorhabdus]|uniref:ABC transporter substrate-binding protein n=1 Tax=Thiomicrorhabdus heinhorstiae TaxID=2748010 RepID=A0ABS0BTD5_9GAMM|nr:MULTISPECIES: CmpA/NrtA family ABC transporter substrate-binding protein [Thiomicrorhabdus]MBF6057108.1 ABC transporter substrate-binding protein [Thiomicrorhabdus heinhorstiae]